MESKLPEEITQQIGQESGMSNVNLPLDNDFQIGYSQGIEKGYDAGATEWAPWKVKYDELEATNITLQMDYMLLKQQHQQLKERAEKMEAALDKIINPIKYMRREAEKEGAHIDGVYAHQLSENASYLKSIAKEALAWKEGKEVGDGG